MTPNQQEEMEKAFEEYLNFDQHGDGRATRRNYLPSSSKTFVRLGFVSAYTLQQEKIEKLEKEISELKKYKDYLCGWDIQKVRDFCNNIMNLLSDIGEVKIKGHLIDSLVVIHSQRKRDVTRIESLKNDLDKATNLLKLTTEDSESYDDAVRIRLRHGLTNE